MPVSRSPRSSIGALVGESRFAMLEDGRRLHYRVLRPNLPRPASASVPERPIVVWIAGMGMSGLYLSPLHRRAGGDPCLGAAASVIYDRAGLGLSDEDDGPRTLERMARDLLALLDELAGLENRAAAAANGASAAGTAVGPPRFVLAGHSWGGPIARVAAELAPERVAGLLLLDPSDEHLRETLRIAPRRSAPALQRSARLLQTLGITRLAARRDFAIDAPVVRELRTRELSRRAARAHEAELAGFDAGLEALGRAPLAAAPNPVTLISGTRLPGSARARVRREAMIAAHESSAAAHPGMRFVRAERSSHLVTLSEPELVLLELATLTSRAGG